MVTGLLVLTSLNAFADRDDDERRSRYNDRFRNMDICAEIKEDLARAEDDFRSARQNMRSQNHVLDNQRSIVRSREQALESKEREFNSANSLVSHLTQTKRDKVRLMSVANSSLNEAESALPLAETTYSDAKAAEKKACAGFFTGTLTSRTCRRAVDALKDAKNVLEDLKNKKSNAEVEIARLNSVETDLARAERNLTITQRALSAEQVISPSVSELRSELSRMQSARADQNRNYEVIEEQYTRLEHRADVCMDMQYEARKSKSFKESLVRFARNNGEGCDSYRDGRRGRGRGDRSPVEDGVSEAYEMVCKSDLLVVTEVINPTCN